MKPTTDDALPRSPNAKTAFQFVILFGVVSLFSDMTHEGARSIAGPFLGTLGASAAMVGIIAGFGEFVGYALRLLSGYVSDKTKRYWLITGIGYALNLLAVPLLALAGYWQIAAVLMILERAGRAIRNPARDVMLSHATVKMGRGTGFGIHEALDQIGATVGPLLLTFILATGGSYRMGFGFLLLPALVALAILTLTRIRFPKPETFEPARENMSDIKRLPRIFWLYIAASSLLAIGFVDYPLLAFHIGKHAQVPAFWTAALYAAAMGNDAVSALVFGKLYDKKGISILIVSSLASFLFAPFVFLGNFGLAVIGTLLWGIGMGAQESIMRAAIGDMSPRDRRATAYGIFNVFYGLSWFAGSSLFGIIYDRSIAAAVVFSVLPQAAAIPLFMACRTMHARKKDSHT